MDNKDELDPIEDLIDNIRQAESEYSAIEEYLSGLQNQLKKITCKQDLFKIEIDHNA